MSELKTVEEAFLGHFGQRSAKRKKRKRSIAEMQPATEVRHEIQHAQIDDTKGETAENILRGQGSNETSESRPVELASSQDKALVNTAPNNTPLKEQRTVQTPHDLRYYLFKPNTTSKVKCLIPVAADTKLIVVLHNQTVLEFPTFYIRQETPEALPAPFITEENYNELYGTDVTVDLPTYVPNDDLEDGEVIDLEKIDEKRVLEVLQEDLNG